MDKYEELLTAKIKNSKLGRDTAETAYLCRQITAKQCREVQINSSIEENAYQEALDIYRTLKEKGKI